MPHTTASHMKTTVEIPDALLKAARRAAKRDGVTIQALLIEGLQCVLESRRRDACVCGIH